MKKNSAGCLDHVVIIMLVFVIIVVKTIGMDRDSFVKIVDDFWKAAKTE